MLETKVRINGMTPVDYAAQWGCDPAYDKPPRRKGDGYLFYNFGSEHPTPERVTRFLGAIDRTIAARQQAVDVLGKDEAATDVANLTALREYVAGLIPTDDRPDFYKLDGFTQGYITAALWAETDESDPETGGDPFDQNYSHADIATETLVQMVADCAKFQADNRADLEAAYPLIVTRGGTPEEYAGHDFWLTRRGHGSGFWDGDWPGEIGGRLTKASKAFRDCYLYVGDDGKIYAD